MASVDDLAQAIARFEGFYQPNSLAARNNNPGNLRSWGSYPVVNGYVKFPDVATGWGALKVQVLKNIDRGLSLNEFFGGKPGVYSGYAPSSDANDPANYARTVAGWLGISADVPLEAALEDPSLPPDEIVTGGLAAESLWPDLEFAGVPAAALEAAAVVGLVSVGWLLLAPRSL
jgi:hypothetical protein